MKRFILFLFLLVIGLFACQSIFAQDVWRMKVKKMDGTTTSILITDVSEVTFVKETSEVPEVPDEPKPSITTGEAVDLGLRVKWASHNVGASQPEEYGAYYAWGEIEEKEDYSKATYKYYKNGEYVSLGNNICGTDYDVAHIEWGGNWRMPSVEEMRELSNECSWEWTTYNGQNGCIVTGPNGNTIFLPAAGYRRGQSADDCIGWDGRYWSGSRTGVYGDYEDNARDLCYTRGSDGTVSEWERYFGLSVRPVEDYPSPSEPVDLGLSVKWASHNVGATKPEEFGGYFAWGETVERSLYNENSYKYYQTKYESWNHIGNNIVGTEYDAAYVRWGGNWRMPSEAEMEELEEQCSWEWTTFNGVNGYKVTGPNGNSIFLPAAGKRINSSLYNSTKGYYWAGSRPDYYEEGTTLKGMASVLELSSEESHWYGHNRCNGCSIRPVYD